MNLLEVFSNKAISLPIIQKNDFVDSLKKALDDFIALINCLNEEDIHIPDAIAQQPWAIKGLLSRFKEDLLKVIEVYLDGKPAAAFEEFKNIINTFGREHLKIGTFAASEEFYRIRINSSNYLFPSAEMFHIPFEFRGIINTQRYSIPGFPCLYLGRTIYGCWEEMRRPNINEFQAVRLVNTKEIRYLDLVPCLPTNDLKEEHYMYLMTWPLIACCSVKVQRDNDPFKPEYIIPQLLLQWVREENIVDGIRYNSTHAQAQYNNNLTGDFSNLAIPVKKVQSTGHCPELKSMFLISPPVSWQTRQFATGGATFIRSLEDDKPLNKKIPLLEIIKGMRYPYSYSEMGDLERYLGYLKTETLF